MSRVEVKEKVLRWAIDRSKTSVGQLRASFPKIEEWLTGETQPTLKQLERLSRATTTPFGMLFLDAPPEERLPIPDFRTVDDKTVRRPSADLLDTIEIMQRRQDWMRDYLADIGQSPVPFVNSATVGDLAQVVARKMRTVLGLDEAWASSTTWEEALRVFRGAMEQAGVLVFSNGIVGNNTHRALDFEEFRGFILVDDYAPLIFVNAADFKGAQMFTLAHELAHVFYGRSAVFNLRQMQPAKDEVEVACNQVAAEFLVPEGQMRQAWTSVTGDEIGRFDQIAQRFKVSSIVAARRALDLRLVDQETFGKFYGARMAAHRNAPAAKGGDFYASQATRIGKRFGAAIVRSVCDGRTSYMEAYSLTGLHGSTFAKYAADIET